MSSMMLPYESGQKQSIWYRNCWTPIVQRQRETLDAVSVRFFFVSEIKEEKRKGIFLGERKTYLRGSLPARLGEHLPFRRVHRNPLQKWKKIARPKKRWRRDGRPAIACSVAYRTLLWPLLFCATRDDTKTTHDAR